MTPGSYLKLRREAAGIALDGTSLDSASVVAIENGLRFPTDIEIQALSWAFPFDMVVLAGLARGIVDRICRACGCTELDACLDKGGHGCSWVENDFCSSCAERARPLPEGLAA